MSTKENMFTVRILDEAGDLKETREVHYDSMRLTRGKKLDLLNQCNKERFMVMNIDIASKVKPGATEMPDGAIKSMDVASMGETREKVLNECTKLLFGLGDVKLDNIVEEDFEPLHKICLEANPLGLIEAEKKMMETQVVKE